MPRPLESYSSAVLAEWARLRGFSYFDEELDAIERRLVPTIKQRIVELERAGRVKEALALLAALPARRGA